MKKKRVVQTGKGYKKIKNKMLMKGAFEEKKKKEEKKRMSKQ